MHFFSVKAVPAAYLPISVNSNMKSLMILSGGSKDKN